MAKKIRWGILSTALIGRDKVTPAMQLGAHCEVAAVASRDLKKAREYAKKLGIAKAYGTYEELLADKEIDAVYNPLPNHLHVSWTIKAAEAGKHVLCEKPLSLNVQDIQRVIRARDRAGVKIGEAFMVHTHPQWVKVHDLTHSTAFGELRAIQGTFSYYNVDAKNIRNIKEVGGGGLYDIGVYPIHTSRFIFGEEPRRVVALMERDPKMKIDRLESVIMDFPKGQALFLTSTQLVPYQRMQFFGTKQRVEIEIPFNAPKDRKCRIFTDNGDLTGAGLKTIEIPVCDQYTIQGDKFSEAILSGGPVPVPLEDSLANLAVVEAIFKSAESRAWVAV